MMAGCYKPRKAIETTAAAAINQPRSCNIAWCDSMAADSTAAPEGPKAKLSRITAAVFSPSQAKTNGDELCTVRPRSTEPPVAPAATG